MKNGQVSIFVLLGILIILTAVFFFSLQGNYLFSSTSAIEIPVNTFIEHCLQQTGEEGIQYLSLRGGYYTVPEPRLTSFISPVAVYLFENETYIPSTATISQELEDYIYDNIGFCLATNSNISSFSTGPVEEISVMLSLNKISFSMVMPIVISTATDQITLKNFVAEVDSSIVDLLEVSNAITQKAKEFPELIPLSYADTVAKQKGYKLEIIETEEGAVISIIDPFVSYLGKEAIFSFGISTSSPQITSVEIQKQSLQILYSFYPWEYKVVAMGKDIIFSDFTTLFDIDPHTGVIQWTPTASEVGNYSVIIKAENEEDEDYILLPIEVVSMNLPPNIENIPSLYGKINEPIIYSVVAHDPENEIIKYLSNDSSFFIDESLGLINVTFTQPYVASYTIIVMDAAGNYDEEKVTVSVRE